VTDGVAAAFSAIERVHRLMSFHEDSSDVARINSAPVRRKITVSRETYEVLYCARELSHRSGGVFDITIAPSLVSAGFLPHPPPGGPSPEPPSGADAGSVRCDDCASVQQRLKATRRGDAPVDKRFPLDHWTRDSDGAGGARDSRQARGDSDQDA